MPHVTFIFLPFPWSAYRIPSHPIGSILKEKPLEKCKKKEEEKKTGV
jgi:hypothetical protein